MTELSHREIWSGTYKGVMFEIVHWQLGWNYYLKVPKDQLPEGVDWDLPVRKYTLGRGVRFTTDYEDVPVISDLDWHGGITLFEMDRNLNGDVVGYTLGCDYMHLFDEGKTYTAESVLRDVQASIDRLWLLIPNLKVRCRWDGKYYNIDEVVGRGNEFVAKVNVNRHLD